MAIVGVGMFHPAVVGEASRMIGEGRVLDRPESGGRRTRYYIQFSSKAAANIIKQVYPFLLIKQSQARVVLHLEHRKAVAGRSGRLPDDERRYREELRSMVCRLNRFEPIDVSSIPEPSLRLFDRNPNYRRP